MSNHGIANTGVDPLGLTRQSVRRASEIDYATAGTRLGPIVRKTMQLSPRPYQLVSQRLLEQLHGLGVSGEKIPLFRLASDMAVTADIGSNLTEADRSSLRALWLDLCRAGQ